jgi:hypothetical protein
VDPDSTSGPLHSEELENVEVLFTEEGCFFYKAYGPSRQGLGTTAGAVNEFTLSTAWVCVICELVKSKVVPACILPHGFPNPHTFRYLSRFIQTDTEGYFIHFNANFFDSSSSYFDFKPEKVRARKDLVICPENVYDIHLPDGVSILYSMGLGSVPRVINPLKPNGENKEPNNEVKQHPHEPKKKAKIRDFAATIFNLAMQNIAEDPSLCEYRVLGSSLSAYISNIVTKAEFDVGVITAGIDIERWNSEILKHRKKKKNGHQQVCVFSHPFYSPRKYSILHACI